VTTERDGFKDGRLASFMWYVCKSADLEFCFSQCPGIALMAYLRFVAEDHRCQKGLKGL
jgi:hypothetical protein